MTTAAWSNISVLRPANWPGLVAVVALHLTLGWAAIHLSTRQHDLELGAPLVVRWIAAPPTPEPVLAPPPIEPPPQPPREPPTRVVKQAVAKPAPKPPLVTAEAPAPARATSPPEPPRPQKAVKPQPEVKPALPRAPLKQELAAEAPLVPPDLAVAYRDNPPPVYPKRSRRLGEEGEVLLRVLINPHGHVDKVRLQQSCGHHRLDRAAVAAVRRWHFAPARQSARPVSAWVLVPIQFQLNKG